MFNFIRIGYSVWMHKKKFEIRYETDVLHKKVGSEKTIIKYKIER